MSRKILIAAALGVSAPALSGCGPGTSSKDPDVPAVVETTPASPKPAETPSDAPPAAPSAEPSAPR